MFLLWNLGRWDELAVAIEAAVASGRPFNPLALAKAWGPADRARLGVLMASGFVLPPGTGS
jgi:hypothetical protein